MQLNRMCDTDYSTTEFRRSSKRRKLWELEDVYHYSIIGTCVTVEELNAIVRHYNITRDGPSTDSATHGAFVRMAGTRSHAMHQLQKMLNRKIAGELWIYVKARTEAELTELWDEHFSGGKVAGAYWSLLTHPQATVGLCERAHGEVQMLSRQVGVGNRADIKRTAALEKRCEELEVELTQLKQRSTKQLQERDESLRKLNARLLDAMDAQRQLQFAEYCVRRYESGNGFKKLRNTIRYLNSKLSAVTQRAVRAEANLESLRDSLETCKSDLQETRALLRQYEADKCALTIELVRRSGNHVRASSYIATCENPDLTGRCVLYVGGRNSQCSHFRLLVEKCNGRLIHHDSGRVDDPLQLGTMLSQADAVLCAIDCVNQEAINTVKQFCSQQPKRLVMLQRASLPAFAKGLKEVVV